MKRTSDLKFIEYFTDQGEKENPIRDRLFNFWFTEWVVAFNESDATDSVNSLSADDFTNRRILSLWDNDQPVAMLFLDVFRIDLAFNISRKYLKNLPEGFLDLMMKKKYDMLYSVNGLVISKNWRKDRTDIPLSQVLVSMGYAFAKLEGADAMICYSRNERKMNKVVEEHNSIKFGTFERHNRKVDFLYTPMSSANVFPTIDIELCCLGMLRKKHVALEALKDKVERPVIKSNDFDLSIL